MSKIRVYQELGVPKAAVLTENIIMFVIIPPLVHTE